MSNIFYVNNSFKNVTLNRHFHEEYTISLVYEGVHHFSNEKESYSITPQVIQTVNPFEFHSTTNSSWSHLNIMPTVNLIEEIASSLLQKELSSKIYVDTYVKDETATSLFYKMFSSFEEENQNKLFKENSVIEFLEYLLINHSSLKKQEIKQQSLNEKELLLGLDYINENISNKHLNLDEISLNAGYSKYHFLREFKKSFGVTPNEYVQIKRVSKARELLKKDFSLSSIAYESGFSDQSYMIKVFKKYTGYTPSKISSLK